MSSSSSQAAVHFVLVAVSKSIYKIHVTHTHTNTRAHPDTHAHRHSHILTHTHSLCHIRPSDNLQFMFFLLPFLSTQKSRKSGRPGWVGVAVQYSYSNMRAMGEHWERVLATKLSSCQGTWPIHSCTLFTMEGGKAAMYFV